MTPVTTSTRGKRIACQNSAVAETEPPRSVPIALRTAHKRARNATPDSLLMPTKPNVVSDSRPPFAHPSPSLHEGLARRDHLRVNLLPYSGNRRPPLKTILSRVVANVCTCRNGFPVVGSVCWKHAEELCQSCNSGYHLSLGEETCVENVCKCLNGIATRHRECPKHQDSICESCSTGFVLSSSRDCKGSSDVAECICKNGTPASADKCPADGASLCAKCNSGYAVTVGKKACGKCIPLVVYSAELYKHIRLR